VIAEQNGLTILTAGKDRHLNDDRGHRAIMGIEFLRFISAILLGGFGISLVCRAWIILAEMHVRNYGLTISTVEIKIDK